MPCVILRSRPRSLRPVAVLAAIALAARGRPALERPTEPRATADRSAGVCVVPERDPRARGRPG